MIEKDKTSELNGIFGNLYRQFILRDLFAKIAPGTIAVLVSILFIFPKQRCSLPVTLRLNFWGWLLALASGWIVGMILQHTGIMLRLIKDEVYRNRARLRKASSKEQKELLLKTISRHYLRKTQLTKDGGPNYDRVLERIVVIKEACGNWSMSLGYISILMFIDLIRRGGILSVCLALFLIPVSLLGAIVLNLAHRYHYDREGWFKDSYFEYSKEKLRNLDC